jgi:hypothetical protein
VIFDFVTHEAAIKRELKAALAYQLFGENSVLKIRAATDPMIQEVIKLHQKKESINQISYLKNPK